MCTKVIVDWIFTLNAVQNKTQTKQKWRLTHTKNKDNKLNIKDEENELKIKDKDSEQKKIKKKMK